MKIKRLLCRMMAGFCLSASFPVFAQNPVVTVTHAGYPVNVKSGTQVAYGNGKYVLLSQYSMYARLNFLYRSTTGTDWSLVQPGNLTSTQLNFIAFGAGLFVTVGNDGLIQSSPDGITWTTRASGVTANLDKLYFLNGKFFAAGKARTLLTSTDGITWTTVAFNAGAPDDFFMSVAYGNGVYILAARNDNTGNGAIIYRSTTATNNSWTCTTNSLASAEFINRIQFLNNKFFVFCIGQNMYNSTNGNSWTDFSNSVVVNNPDGTTASWHLQGNQIFNGLWDGNRYIFYGCTTYFSGFGGNIVSTDGVNFTLQAKNTYFIGQEPNYINGKYLICSNEGIVSSTDGLTYQHPGYYYYSTVKTTNTYIAAGMIGPDGQLDNSTDFSNWTSRRPTGSHEFYSVATDGTTVLAGGYGQLYRSTNEGQNWTDISTNPNETPFALAYGNGRFVLGGYDNNSHCFLRYSDNAGVSWTTADTRSNGYLKIKFVNNRFFAFGNDANNYQSRIMTSTDGAVWTDVTPSPGFTALYYKDVAYDGNKYHFLGVESDANGPVQFFTLSTATPEVSSSYGNKAVCTNTPAGVVLGGSYDEGVLEYANGRFTGAVIDVASGQDYIITSVDGSSWTALPQPTYSTITAAYTSGGLVRLQGRANASFTVNYGAVTLPVALAKFEGRLQEGTSHLRWETGQEKDLKGFTVQHSTNGSQWKAAGTVAANGSTMYSFIHTNPAKGANFYRLLTQDNGGKTAQSKVVTIAVGEGKNDIVIYPNPVQEQIIIRSSSALAGAVIFYNSAGQAVKTATLQGHLTTLDVAKLPAGVYRAEVSQGSEKKQLMIIKQ